MSESVPDGWKILDLGKLTAEIIAGQSPNRKEHSAQFGQYGILKTTAIDWGRYIPSMNQEVLDDYEVNKRHEIKIGDILITKAGPAHRVGVVTYVNETPPKMLVSGKMALLRMKNGVSPSFISYALMTPFSQKHIKDNVTGMAQSQTNFTHDSLKEAKILYPSDVKEQKKITTILTSVDTVIEKTEAQIEKLRLLKKGLMQELLTKGIGHTEFKDSTMGKIPKTWEVTTFKDSITLEYGKSQKEITNKNGNYPIIGTSGVTGYTNYYLYDGESTIVGRKGTINKPMFISGKFWAIDTTYYIKDYQGVLPKWFYYLLVSIKLENFNEATGVPSLNRETLYNINYSKPPIEEQIKIVTIFIAVDKV